jgi:hypothetical protein
LDVNTGALLSSIGSLPEISQSFSLPAGNYVLSFDGAIEREGGSLN